MRTALWVPLLILSAGFALSADSSRQGSASGLDPERARRAAAAKAALAERMEARRAAGWTPKSKDEQMLTMLRRLRDKYQIKQDRRATRAAFEEARGEVYLTIARDYIKYGSGYRRAYLYRTDRWSSGIVGYVPTWNYNDYWILDPLAARLSAHFGEKAARSKGIAAAHRYHADTVYARRLNNTSSRIEELQRQISIQGKLGKPAP
ncbi:MAG: hypothetical protein KDA86_13240 [Planctomycetaceae bacterium]|nr:hypothetical protein [Planctomycetaceae bacterium]